MYDSYVKAKLLGELKPVTPVAYRADGSPLLAEGQVYVTKSGQKYHPAWCAVMADLWKEHPKNLLVSSQRDVGERQQCEVCSSTRGTSTAPAIRDFKYESYQWRQLTEQVNQLSRGIADRLLAQGPSAVNRLGPQMDRYAAAKAELERLSLHLSGSPDWTSPGAPNWDSAG